MGFIDNPPIPGPPGPPGPGGEAGAITIGYPRNAVAAHYTLSAVSPELISTPDYNWENDDTMTIEDVTYTFVDDLGESYPEVTITATDNPVDGDAITIGSITYTFRDVLAVMYDILIGEDRNATMQNLLDGINLSNGSTMYIYPDAVQNPDVFGYKEYQTGQIPITDGSFTPIAKTIGVAGNALNVPISTTSSVIELSDSVFSGGVTNSEPNQILINNQEGGYLYSTMGNLLNAIQGGSGFGVDGVITSSGTQHPQSYTASNNIPMEIYATVPGVIGNGLEVETNRNDLLTFEQVGPGYDATPATKGDVRVRTDDVGTVWFYTASEDINTTTSQGWRAIQLGSF